MQTNGYHGTTKENAEKILLECKFIDSNKNNEWLGRGVYFFAYQDHAKWWLESRRYITKEVCILFASLEYTDSQLLDLDNPAKLKEVEDILAEAVSMSKPFQKKNVNLSFKSYYEQLCVACNTIKSLFPEIGIIIYTFSQKRVGKNSGFRFNQRQICVIKSVRKI